jgi:hypothetical protein
MNPDWKIRRAIIITLLTMAILAIGLLSFVSDPSSIQKMVVERSFDLVTVLVIGYVVVASAEDTVKKIKGVKNVS